MARDERASQLHSLQRDVLDEVCQTRQTESAVALTEDLVKRRRILRFGDPLGIVRMALDVLNHQGLVTYNLRVEDGVPIHIRATTDGFHVAGYRLRQSEAGRQSSAREEDDGGIKHPGDRTDYRTHRTFAEYGEIERMPLVDHVEVYPDHDHWEQLREMTMMGSTAAKGVDRAEVLRLHDAGLSQAQIGERLGVSGQTIYYHLKQAQRVGSSIRGSSIRQDVIDAIRRYPRLDSESLMHRLRESQPQRSFGLHEVQHVIASLHRQGLVTYVEQQNGAHKVLRRIEMAAPAASAPEQLPEPPVIAAVESIVKDALADWPILSSLKERFVAQAAKRERADKYLEAAELIGSDDGPIVASLLDAAERIMKEVHMDPVEAEYLAFADRALAERAERESDR